MWKPRAALLRSDWTEKPAARAYRELVLGQWWTRAKGHTTGEGAWSSRAYHGIHKLTVTKGGYTATQEITCMPDAPLIEIIVP